MTTLAELHQTAPQIASFVEARIKDTGLCFLGTTRADGWPRVSPIELFVSEGRIYVGSMPGAVKARDLQRDPRCSLVTPLADKDDMAGEGKLFCRAREVFEAAEYEQVRAAVKDANGFDMGEQGGSHVFELDIEGAAWQRVERGEDFCTTSWTAAGGVRERARRGTDGQSIEV
jgi:hypothetical protein